MTDWLRVEGILWGDFVQPLAWVKPTGQDHVWRAFKYLQFLQIQVKNKNKTSDTSPKPWMEAKHTVASEGRGKLLVPSVCVGNLLWLY